MSKAKDLLKLTEEDVVPAAGYKWVDDSDGGAAEVYTLKNPAGEEVGSVAQADYAYHGYVPDQEMPVIGPFETAQEAAMELESHLNITVDVDQEALPEAPAEDDSDDEEQEECPNLYDCTDDDCPYQH